MALDGVRVAEPRRTTDRRPAPQALGAGLGRWSSAAGLVDPRTCRCPSRAWTRVGRTHSGESRHPPCANLLRLVGRHLGDIAQGEADDARLVGRQANVELGARECLGQVEGDRSSLPGSRAAPRKEPRARRPTAMVVPVCLATTGASGSGHNVGVATPDVHHLLAQFQERRTAVDVVRLGERASQACSVPYAGPGFALLQLKLDQPVAMIPRAVWSHQRRRCAPPWGSSGALRQGWDQRRGLTCAASSQRRRRRVARVVVDEVAAEAP